MEHSEEKPQIQQNLFELLFLIRIKMKDVVQDADAGLSPLQILILRILAEEGEVSQAMLVQKTGRDKSQVTRLVQELENKNILIKERSKKDRRSFIIKPIEDVQKKVSFFIQREHEMVSEMLAGMSEGDIKHLDTLLLKMKNNIKSN